MKFTELEIPGVILVEPDVFPDERGFFTETFHREKYAKGGIAKPFVQDNFAHSRKNVLRGLHFQDKQAQGKLVYAVSGAIFDVAVDVRRGSPSYGKWVGRRLTAENHHQMYVPEGCAHGYLVLSDESDVMYKCTDLYAPQYDRGLLWNDPAIRIQWPVLNPILSAKDAGNPALGAIPVDLLPAYA
ncbi:MAG TPA: dTDP-4-dehydrorhamnose 3,5-epimerase [Kiritimatiellia bacterium]|jgi:dTDP-4-dehydrorhamnose 3,5-epimerase